MYTGQGEKDNQGHDSLAAEGHSTGWLRGVP